MKYTSKLILNGTEYEFGAVGGRLPAEYQEVEWIGTDTQSGQYIDTGVAVASTLSFEFDMLPDTSYTNNVAILGNAWDAYAIFLYVYQSGYRFHMGGGTADGSTIANQKVSIKVDSTGLTIDGNLYSITAGSHYGSGNIKLFNVNNVSNMTGVFNLYEMKIKDSGTLVRDLVPCYRIADSVIGMYDIVNDTFYTNDGNGSFTKGQNV